MKYANIYLDKSQGRVNLGDCMQLLAIDNLYSEMGIASEDIVRIGLSELSSYDGEYVVLPIAFPFASFTKDTNITQFSERIVPVFLSLCILTDALSDEEIDYLKANEPIGCRDLRTMETMRKHGIKAYLNGCMTLSLPKQKRMRMEQQSVYLIDVPQDLRKIIPDELMRNACSVTPIVEREEFDTSCEAKAASYYKDIIDNASMVITTRLHAALPCAAAGIPVVFFKDDYSYRFAGIDRVVPFYSKESYDRIDWNPQALDFESHKQEVLDIARTRLETVFDEYQPIYDLSYRLETGVRPIGVVESITNTQEYLAQAWGEDEDRDYVLWGLTQTASSVYSFVEERFPHAELRCIFDRAKRERFFGRVTELSYSFESDKPVTVICCAAAAAMDAKAYAEENGFEFFNCFGVDDSLIFKTESK